MKRTGRYIVVMLLSLAPLSTCISQDLAGMGIKKGIRATGGISLSNIVYGTNDSINRRDPYQAILSGNLNLNLFGYDVPFSFIYSNSQRSYTQPFNRMSFTPTYKWIRAYIGRTSMTFSPWTLSGHSFSGAGLELTPGNWRLSMMGGQFKKAIEYDPLTGSSGQPAYKRMGYGVKFGYEKGASGIIVNLFTAEDDANSIRVTPQDVAIQPLKNTAAGISGRTSLFGHFSLEGEYSVSFLNSVIPFASTDSLVTSDGAYSVSPGSKRFDAFSVGTGYQSETGGIMLKYERVAPDYQTLGAYYFNNDLENLTIAPSARFLSGRLSVSGNVGMQRNNLDKNRESTTKRFVGAGNVNFNASEKWVMTFNYSNFSAYTNMKPRDDPFFRDDMDTLNFYQVTNQAGGSVNHTFGKQESPGSIMLFTSYQKASEAGSQSGSDFFSASASYSQTILPGFIVSFLYNVNTSDSPDLRSLYHGPGVTFSKFIKEKNLRTSFNSTFNKSTINSNKGSPVLSTGLNINWSAGESEQGRHGITSNITWVQRFKSHLQEGRREVTATLNYSYSF